MLTNKVAIITGVSSGIGKSILLSLLNEGCHIHGIVKTAERKQQLEDELSRLYPSSALKSVTLHVCNLQSTEQIESFAKTLHSQGIAPNILILNAGIGLYGPHEELSVRKLTELSAVNFTAPLLLTNLFLRDIKACNGHILFISSVTANKTNNTHGCAYGATKAGISSFAKSLFEEVRKYGVRVTVLSPDMTKTALYRDASFCAYDAYDTVLTPDEVASYALFALTAREGVNISELIMQPQRHRLDKK